MASSAGSSDRAPTMEDVARRAGVSRALVSLVMRDAPNVSDARRQAVLKAAAELDYRPNAAARSLAERRTRTIGVVLNDLHNTFFADVVDGINEVAEDEGYRLLLTTARRADDNELAAVEVFLEHRVDAVVVLGPRASSERLAAAATSAPLVVVGSSMDGIDVVVNDDELGGEMVTRHLIELGHTRIVHIDGGAGGGAAARRQGYVGAMSSARLEPWVIDGDFTEASGAAAIDRLVADQGKDPTRRPTAVFAANDLSAVGALDRLEAAGLSVPDDVSLVGYDNTAIAGLGHVDLTTVHQPRAEMGRQAMELALSRIEGGRRTVESRVLAPELIVRGTSRAP